VGIHRNSLAFFAGLKTLEIMITYTLDSFMAFMNDQKKRKFQGINVLLEIMNCESISPNRKRDMIVAALRTCEMFDIGYQMAIESEFKFQDKSTTKNWEYDDVHFVIELYRCQLLNVNVDYQIIMN